MQAVHIGPESLPDRNHDQGEAGMLGKIFHTINKESQKKEGKNLRSQEKSLKGHEQGGKTDDQGNRIIFLPVRGHKQETKGKAAHQYPQNNAAAHPSERVRKVEEQLKQPVGINPFIPLGYIGKHIHFGNGSAGIDVLAGFHMPASIKVNDFE